MSAAETINLQKIALCAASMVGPTRIAVEHEPAVQYIKNENAPTMIWNDVLSNIITK